jgi:hypothetical protein
VTAIDLFAFNGCTNLKSVTVTGGLNNGTVVSGGVIDTYFKKGAANNWILSYAPDAAESLILRDIGSKNYNPNDTGLGRGIEGDAGRELYYSDGAKYTWNSGTLKWDINKYAVTLTPETGISGFRYSIDGALSIFSSGFFYVPHGSDLTVTAVLSDGYAFVSWSEDSVSKVNQLTISDISGPVNLTANGGLVEQYLTSHYVTFGSGSNYTVYANGSPVSSPVRVTGGGSLSFTVQTSEGYSASPNIEGIAGLIKQSDGSYLIQNVHSNLNVTITVSADSGSGSNSGNGNGSESDSDGDGSDNGGDSENSNGSDNGNDNGSGNSNSSGGDSAVIPYWVPVLISAAFLAAIAWIFFFFKRRKDDEEEENSS